MTPIQLKAVELAMKYRLPWGKYRGKALDDIPSTYLAWLSECCDNPIIASHAEALWQWREEMDEHRGKEKTHDRKSD